MSPPSKSFVQVNGHTCRVWQKGKGPPLGFLPGLRGCPRWPAFLDRLAEKHRVVAPSPPGFPGSPDGHRDLDEHTDWIAMTLDLLEAAGIAGADLIGASVGGMLAAEAAAFCTGSVGKLVLIDAYGLYDDQSPPAMFFANTPAEQDALLAKDADALAALTAAPEGASEEETLDWEMQAFRANESSARLIWPWGDRGLERRLHRIRSRTLVLWGADDAIFPASYAERFREGISGPAEVKLLAGAGHLAWLDRPEEAAATVSAFLED